MEQDFRPTGLNYDHTAVRDETGRVLEGPYKHLRVLERRMHYLQKRIQRGIQEGKTLTYDEQEAEALEWALNTIYEWVELPKEE